ncbi:MAG TPA: FAD binding domain-containing protein, partial [Thermodesulfobacteriota bacterium]|nr:FAD binding domain-containing protein [Thermodesulfobacteriota bacterium]
VEPKSIEEASSILLAEEKAKILAGGTDLLVNMKHRVEQPSVLVNIKKIGGLETIQRVQGGLHIGSLISLKKLSQNSLITGGASVLSQAASAVGSYHHQSMGTLGGNLCQQNRCKYFNQSQWWRSSRETCFKAGGELCHVVNQKQTCYASYCGDVAPALLALGAKVILKNRDGFREAALESLFSGKGQAPLTLLPGEILSEIVVPEDSLKGSSGYVKFSNRESIDFPIVGMAFWQSGDSREYRIAFTALDRRPLRANQVESLLRDKPLTPEVIEEAVTLVTKEAKPVKSSLYSPAYKRKLMGILFRQALTQGKVNQ